MKSKESLSPFLESASHLDQYFNEVISMSHQLEEADIHTEFGLAHARKILARFGETGEKMGTAIQELVVALNDAKTGAEAATQKIAERAYAVKARLEEQDQLSARFQVLGNHMQTLSNHVAQIMGGKKNFSETEKSALNEHVPQIVSQLAILADEAFKIKADAQNANLRSLEKDASALNQSIHSMRDKLSQCIVIN